MGVWLSLLLSSSVASERPKLHVEELLDWPFWRPEHHPRSMVATEILLKTDRILRALEGDEASELVGPHGYAQVKPILDSLVFEYFGLRDEERVLVTELADFAGPSLQPASLRYDALIRPLQARPGPEIIERYCARVHDVMHKWRDVTGGVGYVNVVPWTARTLALGAAVIHLSMPPRSPRPSARFDDDAVLNELEDTLKRVAGGSGEQLVTVPDLTIVDGDRIFIIKPLVARFWLQRAAMEDASRIAAEIQLAGRMRVQV